VYGDRFGPELFGAGFDRGGLVGVSLVWLILYPILAGCLVQFTRSITGVSLLDVLAVHRQILFADALLIGVLLLVQFGLPGTDSTLVVTRRLSLSIAAGAASYSLWILTFARSTVVADVFSLMREIRGRKTSESAPAT